MVWVGTSCRWGRGRIACWRREVAGALCAARWPLARRKIARHRMLNLGETRRKHVSGIFWVSKRRRYCNEHPLGGSAARCPQPTCRTRRLLSCRCGFLERPTCGFQLQSRHSDIGSIFSNMYGCARANMPVGIRSGARQAHVFKLCTRTCAQICMGPCARFLLCAVAAQKRGFFVRFPTGLGAQALKARSLTSAVGGFCAHCRYCNLALSGMHYIVKAV